MHTGFCAIQGESEAVSALNARIASRRSSAIHVPTTRLSKTHATVVVESLSASAMLTQKHIPDVRRCRRDLSDVSMAEIRGQSAAADAAGTVLNLSRLTRYSRRRVSATYVVRGMTLRGTRIGHA